MAEAEALAAIGRANRNIGLIRRHGERSVMAVFCIVRLADLEQMAGVLGPESADLAIEEFHTRMQGLLRHSDELIALSARKWALLLKGITSEDHVALAIARLERLLAEPVIMFDQPVMLRVNLGYRVIEGTEQAPERVFWAAEESLEEAKRAGLTATAPHTEEATPAGRNWVLERDLRQALEDGEFHLYFQPKIDARFRNVVGAEALVRWHSRKHGVLGPGQFIETIENSDLAGPFTHFIFKHACALASRWPGTLPVAVNLPPSALIDDSLSHTICDALSIFDLDPDRLEIEITEGTLMRDLPAATARLVALRELGIRISIDDFGTGQSSLAQLRSLPVDQIKIDRSFVNDVLKQPELVRYIIDLARALKLGIVAEGVEEEAQARVLTDLGADSLQGYWIARPMPQESFIDWVCAQGVG
jgi:EAL domain-containing protein (putative c-di-GMP-specific phosphodiesterase class I)/GGDEF domain-containing protein